MHADELLKGTYSKSTNSGGLCEGVCAAGVREGRKEEGVSSTHCQNRREGGGRVRMREAYIVC